MRGRILNKFGIYFVVIFLITLSEIFWYINVPQTPRTETTLQHKLQSPDHLVYQCCAPMNIAMRKNLFFIKTHKTGSSTVQNVIFRFAKKFSLSVMWPIYKMYRFPISTKTLKLGSTTPDNKYHILAYHTRYTPRLESFQYPGTVMLTLLRHPVSLFESLYDYNGWDFNTGTTLEQFLKAPIKPLLWTHDDMMVYHGYNQMSSDLGFDLSQSSNETAINEFVRTIDEAFDFVMINEYMEASLVLLANLMGWPLEYVTHLNINVRPSNPNAYVLTEEDKLQLMELNKVDTILYNHFLRKFRKCVRQYGESKMNQQVLQLHEMNGQLKERCVEFERTVELQPGAINFISYVPKTNSSSVECIDVTNDQWLFEKDMRSPQMAKFTNNLMAGNSTKNVD